MAVETRVMIENKIDPDEWYGFRMEQTGYGYKSEAEQYFAEQEKLRKDRLRKENEEARFRPIKKTEEKVLPPGTIVFKQAS